MVVAPTTIILATTAMCMLSWARITGKMGVRFEGHVEMMKSRFMSLSLTHNLSTDNLGVCVSYVTTTDLAQASVLTGML